ncbi:MAG: hypothetical protein JW881_07265 [Spirochaetales bacterium]|nr:hypothetical protein [Spirochaetales bacterium]
MNDRHSVILLTVISIFFVCSTAVRAENGEKPSDMENLKGITKYISAESSLCWDIMRKYSGEEEFYSILFDKYAGFSFSYLDLALTGNYGISLLGIVNFPLLYAGIALNNIFTEYTQLEFDVTALLLFMGNIEDLDDNPDTDENFFGHHITPRALINFFPTQTTTMTLGYGCNIKLYQDDETKNTDFTIRKNVFENIFIFDFSYSTLKYNSGADVNLHADFYLMNDDYSWGYENENKEHKFRYSIVQKNTIRFPIEPLNASYIEFNLEGYYSMYEKLYYGETKLNLETNNDYRKWLKGYLDRDITFYKALKANINTELFFLSTPLVGDDFSRTTLDMSLICSYDALFYNQDIETVNFNIDDTIVNGLGISCRTYIDNISEKTTQEITMDIGLDYGFDVKNHENRNDRIIPRVGVLWKMGY